MTRPRPRPLLFDLDGTLIDSIELILGSARYAFTAHGRPAPSDEEWLSGVGIPLDTMFRRYADGDEEVAALIARYREHQMVHHDSLVRCYHGVAETLTLLHQRGHPMALVTSKSDALALRGMTVAGIAHFVDVIVGCDSCTRHKPHPEPVHRALELLGGSASQAIFVGDSVHDIEAGNAAGVVTVAALWGPFHRTQLAPASPSYYMEAFADLPALLDSLAATGGDQGVGGAMGKV